MSYFPLRSRLSRAKRAALFFFMAELESKQRPELDVHRASVGAFNAGWKAAVELFAPRGRRRIAREKKGSP